jgi:hypothetical protein
MKAFNTKNNYNDTKVSNGGVLFFVFVIIISIIIAGASTAKAQNDSLLKNNVGIALNSTVTGSGHGTHYTALLTYRFQRVSVAAGLGIQKRKLNPCSAQLSYEYTLFSSEYATPHSEEYDENGNPVIAEDVYAHRNCNLEVYLFATTSYSQGAYLSQAALADEVYFNRTGAEVDNSKLKLNTAEVYSGFGIRYKITNELKAYAAIGFGAYYSPGQASGLYRPQQDFSLMMRSGISYQFGGN